jgi:hypothetical protein
MEINRAAFGALAVFGVAAAGGGAYLANRHNDAALVQSAPLYSAPAAGIVTETENSIATTPAALAVTPAPAPVFEPAPVRTAAPARRTPAPARRTPAVDRADATISRPTPPPAPAYESPSTDTPVAAAIEPLESTTLERAPVVPDPPRRTYDELTIPADSVIGLQVENAISSDSARVEQQVRAKVTRDVRVQDRVAIPAGARAEGSITLVERGGRLKDQARLGIRFHTIVLADGTRLPINTETIYREGDSPARESAAKIGGGAVGGAVLGAILGGKKGAIIGSTVGAAGGSVAVAASEANPATLPAGSTVTVRVGSPATVTIER